MKLLLIAAMVGSAFAGDCVTTGAVSGDIGKNSAFKFFCQNGGALTGASTGTVTATGADNTCACACATTGAKLYSGVDCATELACVAADTAAALALGYGASGGTTVTAQSTITCGATSFKTAADVAPKVACAKQTGSVLQTAVALEWSGCTLCTKATGTATATCTSAIANTAVTCDDGYYPTAQTIGVDAVTRVCLPEATGATTSTPGVAKVDFVAAKCTACAGDQTGCATGTTAAPTSTAATCSGAATGNKLKCTRTNTGFSLADGVVTDCSVATPGVATYTAATASTSGVCTALTCKTGYTASGEAGSIVCGADAALACAATAVTLGYAATGLPAQTVIAGNNGGTAANAKACPEVVGVAAIAPRAERTAANANTAAEALNAANVGTVTCITGYTAGTGADAPKAFCPTAAGAIVYSGCTKDAAAPASAAQTMIACVLAVVAMYL